MRNTRFGRHVRLTYFFPVLLLLALLVSPARGGAYKVYSTYLWHLQQPNYWPEKVSGQDRYMFAHEHLIGSPTWPGHPQNNIADIFGKDDRKAIYQYRSRDAVAAMGQPDGGAQLSYSGCLIENITSLGDNYELGYGPDWHSGIREGVTWTTTRGKRKLEPVAFTYHHALAPLIDKDALEKEIAINKDIWWKAWLGHDYTPSEQHPKGFRCAEETFSTRIIGELVKAGYEWVIVPNHHLSRTHPNYVQLHGKGLYDAPNPADQINPPNSGGWYSGDIDGRGSTESVPFSFQAHRAKYVDPETGSNYVIVVVPMTDLGSYRDGYSQQGIDILHTLNSFANYDQPCIALFSHDGDNAWGGGFSYYGEAVPNFAGAAAGAGYRPTTIQTFLDENPPPANDIVHVEDGSWFNAADDWGHPQFWNWLWYPQRDRQSPSYDYNDPSTWADIENGWAEDFRNWAVIVAGQNYVSTAEQIEFDVGSGRVDTWRIQDPTAAGANDAELAWHFFLPSLTSGYMYYGSSIDMEVKQTLACNQAIGYANSVLTGQLANDTTGPTVFIPQRYPYNPGSTNYGSAYGYRAWVAPSDFYIWTFAFDVSGVTSMVLKVRSDNDGYNPLDNDDNETYTGGSSVGSWTSYTMTKRDGSSFVSNIFNAAEIDFFIMPDAIADQYWYKVPSYTNTLLDYYVEAYDTLGNVKKSDIQHVFVGSEGGSSPVYFNPAAPLDCDDLEVTYNASGRALEGETVTLAITFDDWMTSNDYAMASQGSDTWKYTNNIPTGSTNATVFFHNGSGTDDDNDGNNWLVAIGDCTGPLPSDAVFDPSAPSGCGDVKIVYYPEDGVLKDATNIFIHVGRNAWADALAPDPLMTGPTASNTWEYTYSPDAGTWEIDCVFNNGAGLWDNNGGNDWTVTVTGCDDPVTLSPTAPEDCDDLIVTYDSSGRSLSSADPVKLAITFDEWTTSNDVDMVGTAGGSWSTTNSILDGSTNVILFFHDGAGTTDGDSDPWMLAIASCSTDPVPSGVTFSPAAPNGCDDVTITYHAGSGNLKDASPVYIHIGHDTWQDVITPDPVMSQSGTNWTYTYTLSPGTEEINAAFNDGASTWDNNSGNDWSIVVSNCSQVVTQALQFAAGTPVITDDPGGENNTGDNFDFNRSGGAGVPIDQGGFGTLGQIYVNYDSSNFYIGGIGLDLSSDTNNGAVLFLSFDTLTHDAENLWFRSGPPNGLDFLHNLAFSPRADIAILLGDEYGDGTYSNFNIFDPAGYDLGQGVFEILTNSFSGVEGARLSQFDGTTTNATTSSDDDGNRFTDRWEAGIPWSSLNATNIDDLGSCHVAGVLVSAYTSGNDRYLSGNYLGLTATSDAPRDANNNYALTFVTLTALEVGLLDVDSDGDGITDDWELRWFGGATNADWFTDSDGDGFNDGDEFRLGTIPTSLESTFIVTNVTADGASPTVTWSTVGGKTYGVDISENLLGSPEFTEATQVTESDVPDGTGAMETYTDASGDPTNGFRCYRIRLITD